VKRNRRNPPEFQKVLLFLGVLLLLLVGSFFIGMYLGTDSATGPAREGPVIVDDAVLNRGDAGNPEAGTPAIPEAEPPAAATAPPAALEEAAPKKTAPPPTRKTRKRKAAPEAAPRRVYAVQVGAFRKKAPAERLADRLARKGYDAYVIGEQTRGKGYFYKVRIGRYERKRDADRLARKIRGAEGLQTFVAYR